MKIFIAGDSTAAEKKPDKRPEAGWGEYLGNFFAPDIEIRNYARNGASTKSFIEDGILSLIDDEIQAGDYFLIQFGHNDQKINKPRGTLPYASYQDNLATLSQVALKHHATPIILSSVTRRQYQEGGTIDATVMGEYPTAAQQFAEQQQLTFLNLHQATQNFLNQFNDETSRQFFLQLPPHTHENYPDGVEDNTHFNHHGAEEMARLVVQEIQQSSSPLKEYLI